MGAVLVTLLLAATILLFLVSRGKWSDAIVDSGREWIIPDALARGELLYRDVVYWFGPFTPYLHATFFQLLGSSFQTLVVAGIFGSVGILAALYLALRRVTGKVEAALWTALALPALIFMPNAGGSILGMGFRMWHAAAFCLVAIALAGRPRAQHPTRNALGAGAFCALAGLCRTEWGLAALAATLLASAARRGSGRDFLRDAGFIVSAALLLFGGTYALFIAVSGPEAIISDAPVLLFGIPDLTRRNALLGGLRDWRVGVSSLLYSSAMWIGAFLLIELVSLRKHDLDRARRRAPLLLSVVVALGMTVSVGGMSGATLLSAAPAVCATGVWIGLRRGSRPAGAVLAGFGIAGFLLSHRRLFHIADAAYVAPPLLFAVCCAAALLRRIVASEKASALRYRLRSGILAGVALLVVLAFAGRFLQYASDGRVPIPGTEGMLSAHPSLVREITDVALVVRRHTREGEGLVVFPEGEVLNYVSGRKNPLRYKLYLPGYLTNRNEEEILREFERWKPRSIVVWPRPVGEYGGGDFGKQYGARIRGLIDKEYDLYPIRSSGRGRSRVLLAFRKE